MLFDSINIGHRHKKNRAEAAFLFHFCNYDRRAGRDAAAGSLRKAH
jgi:hypothetical protein